MNNREIGDKFEEELLALLPGTTRTAMSGAFWDNADLVGNTIMIEAKVRDKESFSPRASEVKKLKKQAFKHSKEWVYIQKTNNGSYALMDLNLFAELWTLIPK